MAERVADVALEQSQIGSMRARFHLQHRIALYTKAALVKPPGFCISNRSLHVDALHIIKVLKQLVKKKFRVVRQITVLHSNQGQPLG